MLVKMKEILDQPEPAPELHDPRRVEEEREMIENAYKKSIEGEGPMDKLKKEHKQKYEKFWEKDHAAKLSKVKKYDLAQYRFKDINKNPQNILVFNGKLLEYLKKLGNQMPEEK